MASGAAVPDKKGPSTKDPITCHVLDMATGLPAVGMSVKLRIETPSNYSVEEIHFLISCAAALKAEAKTNADGRITHWDCGNGFSVERLMRVFGLVERRSVWVLTFATEEYFGTSGGFFPTVEVRFYMDNAEGNHVHVPLLIGPYSYTTYRGS